LQAHNVRFSNIAFGIHFAVRDNVGGALFASPTPRRAPSPLKYPWDTIDLRGVNGRARSIHP
jgi:hypothetical protein